MEQENYWYVRFSCFHSSLADANVVYIRFSFSSLHISFFSFAGIVLHFDLYNCSTNRLFVRAPSPVTVAHWWVWIWVKAFFCSIVRFVFARSVREDGRWESKYWTFQRVMSGVFVIYCHVGNRNVRIKRKPSAIRWIFINVRMTVGGRWSGTEHTTTKFIWRQMRLKGIWQLKVEIILKITMTLSSRILNDSFAIRFGRIAPWRLSRMWA